MCLKENKISWLVGVIEGEGCFSIARGYNKAKYFNVTISITNTDIILLKECETIIRNIIGCNCRLRERREKLNSKVRFDLILEGFNNLVKFLNIIIPFIVGEKKLQAEIMLAYLNRRLLLKGNSNKSPNCDLDDEKYFKAISILKHLTKPVETIRFLSQWDNDIVRAANINKIAELGRNDPTLTN